jgi:hypothetical protein
LVLGSPFAVGLPLTWLLNGKQPLSTADWIRAPFLGVAAIVVVLQNLVVLDVPLRRVVPFFWLAVLLAWAWCWREGMLRTILKKCPWSLLAAGALIYLFQGFGLLYAGVRSYAGRGWMDQFNYTSIAQFLMDEPFSTNFAQIGHRPYLIPAVRLKGDRIGQSVLHGFMAASCGQGARTLFEPVIILTPTLLVFLVFSLSSLFGLGRRQALATAVCAGLLPGLTQLHLECFLSHALSVPMLLFWPVLLAELADKPGWRTLTTAVLFETAVATIYTEIWPLLLAVNLIILGLSSWKHPQRWKLRAYAVLLPAAPFFLLIGFWATFALITRRLDWSVLSQVYPWAQQIEGLGRLWIGDLVEQRGVAFRALVRFCSVAATVMGFWGLAQFARKQTRACQTPVVSPEKHTLRPLACSVFCLVLLPLLVLVKDEEHPYQYYKLLLTISPLLVVGVSLACQAIAFPQAFGASSTGIEPVTKWRRTAACSIMGTVFVMGAAGSTGLVLSSLKLQYKGRCPEYLLRAPEREELVQRLEAIHHQPLLIASADTYGNGWLNAWTAYAARHNRVWVANPLINDVPPQAAPGAGKTLFVRNLPTRLFVLGGSVPGMKTPSLDDGASLVWSNRAFQLWRTGNDRWALPLQLLNPIGIGPAGTKPYFWIGSEPATLKVLAGCAGFMTLHARFVPGPARPGSSLRRLRVRTNHGYRTVLATRGGEETLRVPVVRGKTTIQLKELDRPTVQPLPGDGKRVFLVGVKDLRVQFHPR